MSMELRLLTFDLWPPFLDSLWLFFKFRRLLFFCVPPIVFLRFYLSKGRELFVHPSTKRVSTEHIKWVFFGGFEAYFEAFLITCIMWYYVHNYLTLHDLDSLWYWSRAGVWVELFSSRGWEIHTGSVSPLIFLSAKNLSMFSHTQKDLGHFVKSVHLWLDSLVLTGFWAHLSNLNQL